MKGPLSYVSYKHTTAPAKFPEKSPPHAILKKAPPVSTACYPNKKPTPVTVRKPIAPHNARSESKVFTYFLREYQKPQQPPPTFRYRVEM